MSSNFKRSAKNVNVDVNIEQASFQRSNRHKASYNVDNTAIQNVEKLIESLEHEGGASGDYKDIIRFFSNGLGNEVLQSWAHYYRLNNHGRAIHSTNLLTRILVVLDKHESAAEAGSTFIKLLLTEHVRVLYRGLNNQNPKIIIPILDLMKEVVAFRDSKHIDDLILYFDLSLKSLARILVPQKSELKGESSPHDTPRSHFTEFWTLLIERAPVLVRRDLLTANPKIMSNWLKYIDQVDSDTLVERTFDVLTKDVLEEPLFKKMTKCKILNENVLSKLHFFYNSSNKNLVKLANKFFLTYGSGSSSLNAVFPDNCVWFRESPITGTNSGAPIVVNQTEFKVHNKLLFNMLKFFKPWEDDLQSLTVMEILKAAPELVAPYCLYLVSLGYHDPKMTSYWFGMTLTLGRIINLPIPTFMESVETDLHPSSHLVMQNIVPASLSRQALTKGLQHESLLIRQLVSQLIVFCFRKLEKVLALYDRKGWSSSKANIISSFLSRIPELQIFNNTLNQLYSTNKENRILALSLTVILRHYGAIFPSFFSVNLPAANVYTDIMKLSSLSGIDLAILDNFLQFQEFNYMQMKWWNPDSSGRSLFSSLLRLASLKNSTNLTSLKIIGILQDLLHGTIIFNGDLLAHPMPALVSSLQDVYYAIEEPSTEQESDLNKIWLLIDQCIARCIKTPYKYVDMGRDYDYISPFLMALAEQWAFVDKSSNYEMVSRWVCIFLRNMSIIGESRTCVISMAERYIEGLPGDYLKIYLETGDSSSLSISTLNEEQNLLALRTDSSFFDYVSLLLYQKLKSISRFPINDLDVVGLVYRTQRLIVDNAIAFDASFKLTVDELTSKIAGYAISNPNFKLMKRKVHEPLFQFVADTSQPERALRQKAAYILQALLLVVKGSGEIGNGLNATTFENYVYDFLCNIQSPEKDLENLYSALISLLNEAHLLALSQNDLMCLPLCLLSVLHQLYSSQEKSSISYQLMRVYFGGDSTSEDTEILFGKFLQEGRIVGLGTGDFLSHILTNERHIALLEGYLNSREFSVESIIPFLPQIRSPVNLVTVKLAVKLFKMSVTDNHVIETFVKDVVPQSLTLLKQSTGKMATSIIELIVLCGKDYLNSEQLNDIVRFVTTEYEHKFSAEVIQLLNGLDAFDNETTLKWLSKMTLYITEMFAELKTLDSRCQKILQGFSEVIGRLDIWNMVSHKILNSQLDVILSGMWVTDSKVLEYVATLLLKGSSKRVECSKLVQCLINNNASALVSEPETDDEEYLHYLTTVVLYIMFSMDPAASSNITTMKRLLVFYNGTIGSTDRLLLRILELIEECLSVSWTNSIYTWDFLESNEEETVELIGRTKLITSVKEGLILTLRKDIIEYSTSNYKVGRPKIPEIVSTDSSKTWENLMSFHRTTRRLLAYDDKKSIYDPLFLMLITINNKELVTTSYHYGDNSKNDGERSEPLKSYKFDVTKFLDSKLLQFIICSLGDDDSSVLRIASMLLREMMYAVNRDKKFKEGHIFAILLKRIVYTLMKQDGDGKGEVKVVQRGENRTTPVHWYFIARLCDILTKPAAPLYEKAFRWVLSGPSIRPNDIPLLQELISPNQRDTSSEYYYTQLSWVLKMLKYGIKSKADVNLLRIKNVPEWLFNLTNLAYLSSSVLSTIQQILFKLQRIDTGGSTLITRFGGVSDLELHNLALKSSLENVAVALRKNEKNTKHLRKKLLLDEHKLNIEELFCGYSELIKSQKRLREWTEYDTDNLVKRVCT